ncbi:MAG: FG-GAP repeat protein [Acidobacteria bacterium]|nr:FG-GAP repeat protein [Acidobacteriota bacterium]
MLNRKTMIVSAYAMLVFNLLWFNACAKPVADHTQVKEAPEITTEIKPPAELPLVDASVKLPEPKDTEIVESVKRLYKDSVIADVSRFLVGDFNGDNYQDLAVIVKPTPGKLADLNNELANWILEDPKKIPLPDPTKAVQPAPPQAEAVQVLSGDLLLVILHGHGQNGWRSTEAIQTYLLKNAVGNNMKLQARSDFLKEIKASKHLPAIKGDVIRQTLDGKAGGLYYTGAKYVWRQLDA